MSSGKPNWQKLQSTYSIILCIKMTAEPVQVPTTTILEVKHTNGKALNIV